MATIGVKEAQRKAMREAKAKAQHQHVPGQVADAFRMPGKPPATRAKESGVSKKAKKKAAAPRAKAKAKPAKAKAAAPKKTAAKPGVDRSPLTVGTFIATSAGVSMAVLEKQFKMDAHPLRSKIHAAKHKLGFTIEYDAKTKLYSGHAPAGGAA